MPLVNRSRFTPGMPSWSAIFGPVETISDEERIVVANLMVDLDIERFGIFHADCGALKVVAEPWERRRRHKAENPFSNGADAFRGNDIALKRLTARAIGIPGARIVNDLWRREP